MRELAQGDGAILLWIRIPSDIMVLRTLKRQMTPRSQRYRVDLGSEWEIWIDIVGFAARLQGIGKVRVQHLGSCQFGR